MLLWALSCIEVGPDERVRDVRYAVGDAVVHEVIDKQQTMHDPVFRRTYTLIEGRRSTALGGYRDEGQTGVDAARPPYRDGARIIVLSGAHAFIHTPGSGTLDVSVWNAPNFDSARFNGHYDVLAAEVTLSEDWRVRFAEVREPAKTALTLVSTDQGASWLVAP